MSLDERMKAIAESVVERERRHQDGMAQAAEKLGELRTTVAHAIDTFNAAVAADVPHLA